MEYDSYYDWLCELIDISDGSYDILMHELYNIPYRWQLDLDENRAEDGYVLRGYFHYPDGSTALDEFVNKPCSVLEMLIALAQKMDYLLEDDGRGDRVKLWFWEMVTNLGLDKYHDGYFSEPFGEDMNHLKEIHEICDKWLDRNFSYRGYGSPFPLTSPNRDQRCEHVINQMNDYILEKYVVSDNEM